jgi:hypothetical protein
VAPTPLQRISMGMRSLGNHLTLAPNLVEADGFVGVPVLFVAGVFAWCSRRSLRTQLALVLAFVAALLSLGPRLAVDGQLTHIPLPDLLLDQLPLFNAILPSRISLGMDACLAAVIAFGLDDMRRAPDGTWIRTRGIATIAVVVTLFVLVVTQLPDWPAHNAAARPAVAFALPAALTRAIPRGDPVAITYPYDIVGTDQPMMWQVEDDFGFRLLGGYAYHRASSNSSLPSLVPRPMSPLGTQRFLADQEGFGIFGPEMPVSPELVAQTRSTVSRYDVRLVIVDRSMAGSDAVVELFNDALGSPMLSAGQFSMWANWHGQPSHEQFSGALATRLLRPIDDTNHSGTAVLDATATGFYSVTKVEFILTNQTGHTQVIADGHLTAGGWLALWNTTGVRNGTYTLQSIAYDEFGARSLSPSITITIRN